MKRTSKYLLSCYIIILILTCIMPAVGGQFLPFYLLICVMALLITLVEDKMKTRFLGVLLALFAVYLIVIDNNDALELNNRVWEAEVNRIKIEMTRQMEEPVLNTTNQSNQSSTENEHLK
jgi:hypothetical protein